MSPFHQAPDSDGSEATVACSGVNSFPLITPTRPPPLSGITPMSTLPEALDQSTSTDSAPTRPNVQCPSTRVTFPLAAEYSKYAVSAPRCRPPPLGLTVSFSAVIAPHTIEDPSGVMIESSWPVGGVADGSLAVEVGCPAGAVEPAGRVVVGSGATATEAWFIRVTASRLWASRLPPPVSRLSSQTPVCTPGPLAAQSKASVRSFAVQDKDLASSGPKPIVPLPVQVNVAPVASVITLTSVRSGSRLLLSGWTAMASLVPSGESANPVISCPAGTDSGSVASDEALPSGPTLSLTNERGSKLWSALLLELTHGCSSRIKVLSSAAAVTATTVRPAAAETVPIADPVAVARTTA